MYEDKIFQVWLRKAQENTPPAPIVQEKSVKEVAAEPMPEEINPTTTIDQAQNIVNEAQPAEEIKQEEMEKPAAGADREEQVKQSIGELSTYINEVAKAVYQMQLTQNQSQEITTKIVTMISDYVSNITVERVKNIAEQFMKVEAKKRIAKTLNLEYKRTAADWRNMTVLSPEDIAYINTLDDDVKTYIWPLAGMVKTEGLEKTKKQMIRFYVILQNKDDEFAMQKLRQYKEAISKIFGLNLQ